ncbi:cysteine dioxygenase family protein [Xanthobacter autotrophicus]|uniref:cysteine dioxygenase family protein n=1 Tax=Xanthobacter autotrophicus TaxID=280 RepID=UPI00372C27B2
MTEPVPPALKRFIWDIQSMVELADDPREILMIGADLMGRLVATDDWLPAVFATAGNVPFRQYQLYADGMERFTVVATVLSGGADLPLCQEPFWEISGVLRGAVHRQRFALPDSAAPVPRAPLKTLPAGNVETFSPKGGDGLKIANASEAEVAIAIQVYGGEIGGLARRAITAEGGASTFTSLYANPPEAPAYDILTIQTQIVD